MINRFVGLAQFFTRELLISRVVAVVFIVPLLVGKVLASETPHSKQLSEQPNAQIQFAHQLVTHWYIPKLQNTLLELNKFEIVQNNYCSVNELSKEFTKETLKSAQQQWLVLAQSWAQLTSVSIGPILERRSVRLFNYRPTRPELIEKALTETSDKLNELDLIGAPAKGLPAAEWLLFNKFEALTTQQKNSGKNALRSCRYITLLTRELAQELNALQSQFGELETVLGTTTTGANTAAKATTTEFINQLVGAIERIHIQQFQVKKSVNAQQLFTTKTNSLQVNQSQWLAVRELMLTNLLGLLKNQIVPEKQTTNYAKVVLQYQKQLAALPTMLVQTKAITLQQTQLLLETKISDAVGVTIGFSDNDGD